ncbi:conserved hypothetical protein [Verrucomicrobia bacterium]|nr:conserved hypothetical protein [Verrucomicrobiota bacterium]
MTDSLTSNAGNPDLAIREPAPTEVERVLHLFPNVLLYREARLLAAVRSRPIERFVAAAAWWPATTIGMFQIACAPGVDRGLVAGLLIDRLAEGARLAGMERIQCANLLTDDNVWLGILRTYGFECSRSERSFEVAYQDIWLRLSQLHQKHGAQFRASWRVEPIRALSPETALEVIGSHRLLPPAQVRAYWQKNSPGGFSLDLSCILFDGERPFGALLGRRMGEVYYVDVQVVQEPNSRLRSLADLFMLHRAFGLHQDAERAGREVPIHWVRFRSGENEHRQTANLALRMGGRELSPQHVMTKAL